MEVQWAESQSLYYGKKPGCSARGGDREDLLYWHKACHHRAWKIGVIQHVKLVPEPQIDAMETAGE